MFRSPAAVLLFAGSALALLPAEPVHLELRTPAMPARFRIGEVIPLQLSFTSTIPKRYQLNMASYDRGGRMGHEQFIVTPESGTRDPLHLYFASASGREFGGLTGLQSLSQEPVDIHLVLNEWIAIERPGAYRLKVTSFRVRENPPAEPPSQPSPGITSNEMELEILPAGEEWQHAELQRAVEESGDPALGSGPAALSASSPILRLRYLGTADAARELARRLRGTGQDLHCAFGLIGASDRRAGLDEMLKLLRDPDFPVTSLFLTTMAILPLHPEDDAGTLQRQRTAALAAAKVALIGALPAKRGEALKVSTETARANPM